MSRQAIHLSLLLFVTCLSTRASAGDWPTWRYDASRTGTSPETLPDTLHLQWIRHWPALVPAFWQVRQERVQFDRGYEPIVLGKTVLVGSSRNDSLTALDVDTGQEKWRFYTDGPVRLAPVGWQGKVYCGSDDGCLYCLAADSGKLLWKYRAVPSERKALGNGRLISVWPVRGGPVIARGRVYFTAGVWPFEGIFVTALDAETGQRVWVNDSCGSRYIEHPHAAMAFGGPSPQGYLMVRGNELVVPSSRAFPAFFDLDSGKLVEFAFGHGGFGSRPGSWFVATDTAGQLVIDPKVNTEMHDGGQQIIGQRGAIRKTDEVLPDRITIGTREYRIQEGVRSLVSLGGKAYRFDQAFSGVTGTVHSVLAADGKLFVVTQEGDLYCFGPARATPKTYPLDVPPLDRPADAWTTQAQRILKHTDARSGYAVVLGLGTGRLAEALAAESQLHVIVVEPDAEKVQAFRQRLDQAGLYGTRIVVHQSDPLQFALPPYLASLIVSEDRTTGEVAGRLVETFSPSLRPYGGTLCLELADQSEPGRVAPESGRHGPARNKTLNKVSRDGSWTFVTRTGPLPGTADYTGQENFDELVRSPMGLLWFGDTFHHHKLFYKTYYFEIGRGLPTEISVAQGVMKYTVATEPYGPNRPGMSYHDYLRFLERTLTYQDGYTDIYTGRVLTKPSDSAASSPTPRAATPDRPATVSPVRTNPLTGLAEGREFLKMHGCDQSAVDYGHVLTMRSGTAAYYDKTLESGTINISGMRSGCRNSIIPAGGVLCLPSWTGNCVCNYPVYTSLALVHMPAQFEQWTAWGGVAIEAPLGRVGLNFGAPGDRATDDGTLWLDYPSVGGPSPVVPVKIEPENVEWFYRHAVWMKGGQGWPWVTASGVKGVQAIRIEPVALRSDPPGETFSVRWLGSLKPPSTDTYTFAAKADHGVRLWIGDQLVLDNSKNLRRGSIDEIAGTIALPAGVLAPLKLEYYQLKGRPRSQAAFCELHWSSPSMAKTVLGEAHLQTADGQPGGLTGLYYDSGNLTGPAALQVDPELQFAWGQARPAVLTRLPRPLQLPRRTFTVRLFFAEPDGLAPGQRVFSIKLQGQEVLPRFDIAQQSGGPDRGVVQEFKGIPVQDALAIEFRPTTDKPAVIGGVELIAEGP
jgi:outer membrane protein assembly factor BamB